MIANIVSKVKKTVSGVTSATLTDCNDTKSLVLLELDGKASGLNVAYFDFDNAQTVDGGYKLFTFNGKPSTTYSILIKADADGENPFFKLGLYSHFGYVDSNGTYNYLRYISSGTTESYRNALFWTFTTPSNMSKMAFKTSGLFGTHIDEIKNYMQNIMLVEGTYTETTMPPYQPYQIGSGDKTENILDVKETLNPMYNHLNTSTLSGAYGCVIGNDVYLKASNNFNLGGMSFDVSGIEIGKTYTAYATLKQRASLTDGTDNFSGAKIYIANMDNSTLTTSNTVSNIGDVMSVTFTPQTTNIRIGFAYSSIVNPLTQGIGLDYSKYTVFEKIMIVNGTSTDYIPFGYKIGVLSESRLININNGKNSYPSDRNTGATTLRTFEFDTYVTGMSLAGYYVPSRIVNVSFEDNAILFNQTNAENQYGVSYPLALDKGKTYTLSCDINSVNNGVGILYYKEDGTKGNAVVNNSNITHKTINFTVPNDAKYSLITFTARGSTELLKFSNVMLYESNKTPISLPTYIGSTPLAQGEKVSVNWENKEVKRNQDLWHYTKVYKDVQAPSGSNVRIEQYADDMTFKPNTRYVMTMKFKSKDLTYSSSGVLVYVTIQYTDGTSSYAGIQTDSIDTYSFTTLNGKTVSRIFDIVKQAKWTGGTIDIEDITWKELDYQEQDLTNLNTNLLNATQTTFEGTTVITDASVNKVSGIKCDYYASKE